MNNIKFKHVPKPVSSDKKPKPSDQLRAFCNYHAKDTQHRKFLKIMKLPPEKYSYDNTRICSTHEIIKKEKKMTIEQLVRGKITKQEIKFEYDVPAPIGVNSTLHIHKPSMKRKTNARQRRHLSEWNNHKNTLKNKFGEEHANNWMDLASSYQQTLEFQSPSNKKQRSTNDYNPFLPLLGINLQSSSKKKRGFKRQPILKISKDSFIKYKDPNHHHPTVMPNSLSKRQIKEEKRI